MFIFHDSSSIVFICPLCVSQCPTAIVFICPLCVSHCPTAFLWAFSVTRFPWFKTTPTCTGTSSGIRWLRNTMTGHPCLPRSLSSATSTWASGHSFIAVARCLLWAPTVSVSWPTDLWPLLDATSFQTFVLFSLQDCDHLSTQCKYQWRTSRKTGESLSSSIVQTQLFGKQEISRLCFHQNILGQKLLDTTALVVVDFGIYTVLVQLTHYLPYITSLEATLDYHFLKLGLGHFWGGFNRVHHSRANPQVKYRPKYGPTCHQWYHTGVTNVFTLVRLSPHWLCIADVLT